MSIKKIVVALFGFFVLINVYAQSIDEPIGNAMNNKAWSEVRHLYLSEGENIQTPFLKPYTKFFIPHFYNQPDLAI